MSCSCMPNIASVAQNHNTDSSKDPAAKEYSYRKKSNCLLAEKYLLKCTIVTRKSGSIVERVF